MVRPDSRRLTPVSYAAPVSTEYWDDDATAYFRQTLIRPKVEGMILERKQ